MATLRGRQGRHGDRPLRAVVNLLELQRGNLAALWADEVRDRLPLAVSCQPRIAGRDPLENLVVLIGDVIAVVIAHDDGFHSF